MTDFDLQVIKFMVRSLAQTLVVQECHLWLNLSEMRDANKACFLDVPISQVGLFGDIVEEFTQQFLRP